MKEIVAYRINSRTKESYEEHILEKYGHKRDKCVMELDNTIKLYLTINSCPDYINDPDVQELLAAAKKFSCTHTHPKDDANGTDKKSKENDEDRLAKMEKEIKELKEQLAEQSKPVKMVNTDMDMFVQLFKDKYGHDEQVSYNDISNLIVKTHGVVDKRSIENRVQYLMASGCIESFAPNVFNVRF